MLVVLTTETCHKDAQAHKDTQFALLKSLTGFFLTTLGREVADNVVRKDQQC